MRLGVAQHAFAVHRDLVATAEEAETTSLKGRGGNLGHGDGFKCLLHRLHHLDRFAAAFRTDGLRGIDGAQSHLLATAPAGEQADAGFDQAHVEFRMRPARRGVQRHFAASAKGHAKRCDNHRLGRELDELRHVLELAHHHVHVIPLLILHGHQQQHDVGADGEIRRVIADDEGVKVRRPGRRA